MEICSSLDRSGTLIISWGARRSSTLGRVNKPRPGDLQVWYAHVKSTKSAAVCICVLMLSACRPDPPTTPATTSTSTTTTTITIVPAVTAATTTDLIFCVTETNRYRAMVGRAALQRSTVIEAYAAEGARNDGTTHVSHGHFISTQGGHFTVRAENELPWWPFGTMRRTVEATMIEGWAAFWKEGPRGGHYQALMGNFTEVGCGVYIANNEITVVQDFR